MNIVGIVSFFAKLHFSSERCKKFTGKCLRVGKIKTMLTLVTVSNHGLALYISTSFYFIILWVRIILIDSSGEKITFDAIWIADTNLNMILFSESSIRI